MTEHLLGKNEYSDDEIVMMIREGKEDFFSTIVDRYSEKIANYIFPMLQYNSVATNDCLQEIFLKVWKNLNKYQTGTNFNAWMYRLAHNLVIDTIKKNKNKDQFTTIDEEEFEYHEDKLDQVNTTFQHDIIKKILWEIDEKYKSLILLYYYEEKSYEEIAEILDIPINTVWTLLSRAKTKIKKIVNSKEQLFYFS